MVATSGVKCRRCSGAPSAKVSPPSKSRVSGGGLVRVTINGLSEIKKLHIDPSLMKPEEAHVVEDLVVAACDDGKNKLEARRMQDSQFIQDSLASFDSGKPD